MMFGLALGGFGCSSTHQDTGGESLRTPQHPHLLRKGMTYSEVKRALRSVDPGIKDDIATVEEQERDARKERKAALAELRTIGVDVNPDLHSSITVDRGDYVLLFENGRLHSWEWR